MRKAQTYKNISSLYLLEGTVYYPLQTGSTGYTVANEKDYKRLYDEIIEYLLYDLKLCDNEENRHKYEQDFDALENSICRKEEFDLFFGGRKALWKIVGLY